MVNIATAATDLQLREALAGALVGREWTDAEGHTWTVKSYQPDSRGTDFEIRIVRKGSRIGRWQTIEQVQDYLVANTETKAEATEPAKPHPLVGESWTDEGETLWTITRETFDGQLVAENSDGDELFLSYFDAQELVSWEPNEYVTLEATPTTVDPELANAGAIEDEQIRNRQLNPDAYVPRVVTPESIGEGALLDDLADALRRMQAALLRSGGKATVTATITLEEIAPRELEIIHQVAEAPPKVKQTSSFFLGGLIAPGLPKRAIDAQLTINDAPTQEPDGEGDGDDPADTLTP